MRKGRVILAISIITTILLIVLVMAIDTISTGWKVTTTEKTINVWSNCKTADKTGGGPDVFAPTKTAAEWNAFIANVPGTVTLGFCGTWAWGSWGICGSVGQNCGTSTQSRTVICEYPVGTTVSDTYCDSATKPSTSQSCDLGTCSGTQTCGKCEPKKCWPNSMECP